MATQAETGSGARLLDRLIPDRLIGLLALAMLATVLVAIVRGQPRWGEASAQVWVHLVALVVVLAVTPVQLWSAKGTRPHRVLGYAWIAGMAVAAGVSFWIRDIADGGFSPIHLLSMFVLVQLPRVVLAARAGRHESHRRHVRFLTLFAILVAGFFTFPFGRMLGVWLFG